MYKLAAVIPLFLNSLFIVANTNSSLIHLNNDNDNYQNTNLLISYGGGGNSPKDKANKKAKQEKAKLLFKKRQAEKKAAEGIPLTEEEKLLYFDWISEYEIRDTLKEVLRIFK